MPEKILTIFAEVILEMWGSTA